MLTKINEIIINYNQMNMFHIDIDTKKLTYNLLLTLGNDESFVQTVSLYFYDITSLKINEVGGGLIQIMHPKIVRTSEHYDRVNYYFSDLENQTISFYFKQVDILP